MLTVEQLAMNRAKARVEASNTEASEEQTEVVEEETVVEEEVEKEVSTEPEEDNTEEEVVEELDETEETVVEESEDNEKEEDTDESDETDEELEYYQIGDIEATLEEVKEWKEGGLRQADYTKKTQEVAKLKEDANKIIEEAKADKITGLEKVAELDVLIKETEENVDMDDLEINDYAEFCEQKRLQDKRKEARDKFLEEYKNDFSSTNTLTQEQQNEQSAQVFVDNPTWLDKDGKETPELQKDLKTVGDYLDSLNVSEEQRKEMLQTSLGWKIIMAASKASNIIGKQEVVKKKLKAAPTVTKVKNRGKVLSKGEKEIKNAQAQYNKTKSISDLSKLKSIKRKFAK